MRARFWARLVCAANAVALRSSYFSVACPIPDKCPKASQLRRQAEGAACANSTNCNNCCSHGSNNLCCSDPAKNSGTNSQFCALDWSCAETPYHAIGDVQSAAGLEPSWALGCRNGVACSDDSLFGAALDVAKAADQLVVVSAAPWPAFSKRSLALNKAPMNSDAWD